MSRKHQSRWKSKSKWPRVYNFKIYQGICVLRGFDKLLLFPLKINMFVNIKILLYLFYKMLKVNQHPFFSPFHVLCFLGDVSFYHCTSYLFKNAFIYLSRQYHLIVQNSQVIPRHMVNSPSDAQVSSLGHWNQPC